VLYHDQIGRNILRSPDEGKKWDHINGVPKGESLMLIEHPYDNSIVSFPRTIPFLLTNARQLILKFPLGIHFDGWYNSLSNDEQR